MFGSSFQEKLHISHADSEVKSTGLLIIGLCSSNPVDWNGSGVYWMNQ